MFVEAAGSALLHVKVGLGLIAVVTNIYCVWLVFQRERAANTGRWDDFSRLDDKQHKFGAVVLSACIAALIMGVYLISGSSGLTQL